MSKKDAGIWQVYVDGELYCDTFSESNAIFQFESCVDDHLGEVELVQVLRTTRINELMEKNKHLDTNGEWKVCSKQTHISN